MNRHLRTEPSGESGGQCDCCGKHTRTIWGYIYSDERAVAAYFLQWTRHTPEHFPNLDFLVGTWGDDMIQDRKLVSWAYRPSATGFMVIDSADRPAARSPLCARALARDEVLADADLLALTAELVDAVWIGDPRAQEVRELAGNV
jgi:hypothetical protein